MKTLDDIQILSLYKRYIIKENNQNYTNPLKQVRQFKINRIFNEFNKGPLFIDKTVTDIFIELADDKTIWTRSGNGNFILNNPNFNLIAKAVPITSLNENQELILKNVESNSDAHLNYQLNARIKAVSIKPTQLILSLEDIQEPKLEIIFDRAKMESYKNYKPESTFLPRIAKASQIKNLFKGARTKQI